MNTLQSSGFQTVKLLRAMRDEAQAIQERQATSVIPHVDGIECFAERRQSLLPGGDFFDLTAPGPSELIMSVGTLPIKGIAGPILMTGLLATLRSLGARGSDLAGMLTELNRIMWNIAPERTFASLFSAHFVPHTGRLHYINAGHEAALLLHAQGNIERLEPHAPVLGLSRHSQFHRRSVRFEAGDTLIALTEGSEPGARRVFRDRTGMRLRELPVRIIDAADAVAGFDTADRTVVVVHHNCALAAAA